MTFRPGSQHESDVHSDVLLSVGTRWHVEKPPSNEFETTVDLGPCRGSIGLEPLCPQLDWEAHPHQPDVGVVWEQLNRRRYHATSLTLARESEQG